MSALHFPAEQEHGFHLGAATATLCGRTGTTTLDTVPTCPFCRRAFGEGDFRDTSLHYIRARHEADVEERIAEGWAPPHPHRRHHTPVRGHPTWRRPRRRLGAVRAAASALGIYCVQIAANEFQLRGAGTTAFAPHRPGERPRPLSGPLWMIEEFLAAMAEGRWPDLPPAGSSSWRMRFKSMFSMSEDSWRFYTAEELEDLGLVRDGNRYRAPTPEVARRAAEEHERRRTRTKATDEALQRLRATSSDFCRRALVRTPPPCYTPLMTTGRRPSAP